ncbi:hypothetical protein H4582DRAFT_1941385 [Lactarius indigo]|nr:hypothetical protein H4582DRAFT_1941385 [Lactarius indigo]
MDNCLTGFFRKLKSYAKPVKMPEDPNRLVTGQITISEATRLWIKGREFTIARLLGDAYKDQVERYAGGALVIFWLAPQDYHRFHSPIVPIDSPQFGHVMAACVGATMVGSIKTTVSEGDLVKRGQDFGYFAFGGSASTSGPSYRCPGRDADFPFVIAGGSTIVCVFEKNVVEWDEDLLINGHTALETLVRVGMGIGRRQGSPAPLVNVAAVAAASGSA